VSRKYRLTGKTGAQIKIA